jgi:hypothetical protein
VALRGGSRLALVNLNSARCQSPNSKAIGGAGTHFNEVVMRDDAVEAAVVFVDGLVTGLTVAIEGTFNSDGWNRRQTRISWLIHSAPKRQTPLSYGLRQNLSVKLRSRMGYARTRCRSRLIRTGHPATQGCGKRALFSDSVVADIALVQSRRIRSSSLENIP